MNCEVLEVAGEPGKEEGSEFSFFVISTGEIVSRDDREKKPLYGILGIVG